MDAYPLCTKVKRKIRSNRCAKPPTTCANYWQVIELTREGESGRRLSEGFSYITGSQHARIGPLQFVQQLAKFNV